MNHLSLLPLIVALVAGSTTVVGQQPKRINDIQYAMLGDHALQLDLHLQSVENLPFTTFA